MTTNRYVNQEIPYKATTHLEGSAHIILHSISGIAEYNSVSFEELRLANYQSSKVNNNMVISAGDKRLSNGAPTPFGVAKENVFTP